MRVDIDFLRQLLRRGTVSSILSLVAAGAASVHVFIYLCFRLMPTPSTKGLVAANLTAATLHGLACVFALRGHRWLLGEGGIAYCVMGGGTVAARRDEQVDILLSEWNLQPVDATPVFYEVQVTMTTSSGALVPLWGQIRYKDVLDVSGEGDTVPRYFLQALEFIEDVEPDVDTEVRQGLLLQVPTRLVLKKRETSSEGLDLLETDHVTLFNIDVADVNEGWSLKIMRRPSANPIVLADDTPVPHQIKLWWDNELARPLERIGPKVSMDWVIGSFSFLTALAHLYTVYNLPWYLASLKQGQQSLRWLEYAVTSSTMMVALSNPMGLVRLSTVLSIFVTASVTNAFGFMIEMQPKHVVLWMICGYALFLAGWMYIFEEIIWISSVLRQLYNENTPTSASQVWDVATLLSATGIVLASLYVLFPAIQTTQFLFPADYAIGELLYILSSATAKLFLVYAAHLFRQRPDTLR